MTTSTPGGLYCKVTRIGAEARRCLRPGEHGSVLAVLSSVVYLHTGSQQILWLASAGAPMHRRCLQVEAAMPTLRTGAPFCVDRRGLAIAPGVVLDLAAASLWQPLAVDASDVVRLDELPGRVRALASLLDTAHPAGFGRFIHEIAHGDSQLGTAADDPVLLRAGPAILEMPAAIRRRDSKRVANGLDTLVGLGTGLTPSGDDFLGGLLFGARALLSAYPGSRFLDATSLCERYRGRTHPISWTLLHDCAQGYGTAPLHDIVNGVLAGAPAERMRSAVWQLAHVGHSTGWDMLAGLVAGLLIADNPCGLCD